MHVSPSAIKILERKQYLFPGTSTCCKLRALNYFLKRYEDNIESLAFLKCSLSINELSVGVWIPHLLTESLIFGTSLVSLLKTVILLSDESIQSYDSSWVVSIETLFSLEWSWLCLFVFEGDLLRSSFPGVTSLALCSSFGWTTCISGPLECKCAKCFLRSVHSLNSSSQKHKERWPHILGMK